MHAQTPDSVSAVTTALVQSEPNASFTTAHAPTPSPTALPPLVLTTITPPVLKYHEHSPVKVYNTGHSSLRNAPVTCVGRPKSNAGDVCPNRVNQRSEALLSTKTYLATGSRRKNIQVCEGSGEQASRFSPKPAAEILLEWTYLESIQMYDIRVSEIRYQSMLQPLH